MNRFDYRAQFIIPYCHATIFAIFIDSYPHHAKATLTIPSLLLISIVDVAILVLVSLQRYPLFIDYIYEFTTIGGLATVPITYSARELSSSAMLANSVLAFKMLFVSILHRHSTLLTTLTIPVNGLYVEEDEVVFRQIFKHEFGMFGGGNAVVNQHQNPNNNHRVDDRQIVIGGGGGGDIKNNEDDV
jgi:hypothetical protein